MRVLFVCTGNTCRSPFAEAVARKEGADVESAGLAARPGGESPDDAIAVARELGFDLSSHRARLLTEDMVRWADVVVGMTETHITELDRRGARGKTRLLGGTNLEDPWGHGPDAYRRTYVQIENDVWMLLQVEA